MGIDVTLREISERLAAVNAAAMIQLHERIQQSQLTLEKSYTHIKDLQESNERIEAKLNKFRQNDEGEYIIECYVFIVMQLLMSKYYVAESEQLDDQQRLELFREVLQVRKCLSNDAL